MNNFCVLIFLLGMGSVPATLVNPLPSYPPSCLHIKKTAPQALSGLYDILINNNIVTVYCEMALHGGGFTFIPRDAVEKGKLPSLVSQLFTVKSEVLLRFQRRNGVQPHTLIKQLPGKGNKLGLLMHSYSGYTRPQNAHMVDYLYLGILPKSVANSKTVQGFTSNNARVTFRNGDSNPNSYFAFFPNHREQSISKYHNHDFVYERRGVAVDWRKTGIPSFAHRQLPNDFFFLTEMHFGGGGCYTSSDRWNHDSLTNPMGTAIGVR